MKFPKEGYVSTAQVAVYLGVSTRTLEGWRSSGKGPPAYSFPIGTRGRPPVRYKAEEVRQWPQIKQAGAGAIRAWVIEDGKVCGEAARLIDTAAIADAMLENEDILAADLMEALTLRWRSPDDMASYVREAQEHAQGMIERAKAALSHAQMEQGTAK